MNLLRKSTFTETPFYTKIHFTGLFYLNDLSATEV